MAGTTATGLGASLGASLSSLWTKLSGGPRRRPDRPSDPLTAERLFAGCETTMPSHQNAVNLVPGWSSHFPPHLRLTAGRLPLFDDSRIAWAIGRFGDLNGRSVLELGPLEAAHTSMLVKAGARVQAVESNPLAFLKCLITKEILQLDGARFHLGDFVEWLERREERYDLIVASGVLYHMRDPLRLLRAIAKRTDALYLWTVAVMDDAAPSRTEKSGPVTVRFYRRRYGPKDVQFCGGPNADPVWMHRDDILSVLGHLGFVSRTIAHEQPATADLPFPTFSVFATRGNDVQSC